MLRAEPRGLPIVEHHKVAVLWSFALNSGKTNQQNRGTCTLSIAENQKCRQLLLFGGGGGGGGGDCQIREFKYVCEVLFLQGLTPKTAAKLRVMAVFRLLFPAILSHTTT